MPFSIPPIACSLTPKAMFDPSYPHWPDTAPCSVPLPVPGHWKLPLPARVVFVDGSRSPEPPMREGRCLATEFMTLPPATLVAIPFGSAGKMGISLSQHSGSFRFTAASHSFNRSGYLSPYELRRAFHSELNPASFSDAFLKWAMAAS